MEYRATDFRRVYQTLNEARIKFILIGGAAANLHGSPRFTLDVDIVYSRDDANLEALVACLLPFHPYLRGAPPGLPFRLDFRTLRNGLNFTFTTDLGSVDLLGEVTGGGRYDDLLLHVERKTAYEIELQCVDLAKLIQLKRAAGRPKDLEAIAELEIIRQERGDR